MTAVCGMTGLTLWEGDAEGPPILDIKLLQEEEDQAQLLFLLQDHDSGGYLLRIVSFPGELKGGEGCECDSLLNIYVACEQQRLSSVSYN